MPSLLEYFRDETYNSLALFYKVALKTLYDIPIKTPIPYYVWAYISVGEALTSRKERRVIINAPPSCYKSTFFSIIWQMYDWIHNPTYIYLCTSSSEGVATRDSALSRELLLSEFIKGFYFSKMSISKYQATKVNFKNKQGGGRYSTTSGANLTGIRCDVLIIDDPDQANTIKNSNKHETIHEWYVSKAQTRVNDKGRQIILQQRVNKNDLTGFIKKEMPRGFKILDLPMERKARNFSTFKGFVDKRKQGETLDKKRFTPEVIKEIKLTNPPYVYQTQYQQNPTASSGYPFKKSYFRKYKDNYALHSSIAAFITCDTAMKDGEMNDYTVAACWVYKPIRNYKDETMFYGDLYLIDVYRDRVNAADLFEPLKEFYIKNAEFVSQWLGLPLSPFLIEDAQSGTIMLQQFQTLGVPAEAIKRASSQSKVARVLTIRDYVANRHIFVPKETFGSDDENRFKVYINECLDFAYDNSQEHDDCTDTLTDACIYATTNLALTRY